MSVRTALTWVALTLVISGSVQAQIPFSKSDLPTRSALNRVGLERHWNQVVPLDGTERVIGLSMASSSSTVRNSITDVNPSADQFRGGYELSPLDGAYRNFQLLITDGPLKGEVRAISTYKGETRTFRFLQPFASVPAKGTKFALLDTMIFVQTSENNFYAYNGETGQRLWQVKVGDPIGKAWPASVNSRAVFATSGQKLIALDRQNGERLWTMELAGTPTSPTACDEDLVMVGLEDGRLKAYHTQVSAIGSKVSKGYAVKIGPDAFPPGVATDVRDFELLMEPALAWVWPTDGGAFRSRPLATASMILLGSADGRVYGSLLDKNRAYFRFLTGGAIVAPLSSFGVRTLLVPSVDHNLYGIDIFTGHAVWTYPSGAPIVQEALVSGDDIFVQNTAGILAVVDDRTGVARWAVQTNDAKLIAISKSKLYGINWAGELVIVDRKNGTILENGRTTRETKGLDLRSFKMSLTNSANDRLYFVTPSGSLIALREIDQVSAAPLRDLSQPSFGFIPPEGYTDPGSAVPAPATATPGAEPPM